MTTLPSSNLPHLDARLQAAADFVRPGAAAADIGCDHGKLSAWLAGSGRCPLGFACDLREGPGQVQDIVIAGMGAQTILEILDDAPWVRDPAYNLVLVPATKHSVLRRGLVRRGFVLQAERLCRAAGRWYAVMNARYAGTPAEPDGLFCLCGRVEGQPGADEYRAQQMGKLKKYRRGLPDGPEAAGVDALLKEMEAGRWP